MGMRTSIRRNPLGNGDVDVRLLLIVLIWAILPSRNPLGNGDVDVSR